MSDTGTLHTEPDKIAVRSVIAILFGWLVFVAISAIGLYFYYAAAVGNRTPLKPEPASPPVLQTAPKTDFDELKQKQEARLRGYEWVDKDKGIIHVPVERAMQIVASEGAKAFDPMDTDQLTPADVNASMPGQAMESQGLSPPGARK